MESLKENMKQLLIAFVVLTLFACSSNKVNKTVYDALIQRECIQKTGEPNCDSGQPSYEEYRHERQEILNKNDDLNNAY